MSVIFNPAFVVFVSILSWVFMLYATKKSAEKKSLDKDIWEIGLFTAFVQYILVALGIVFGAYILHLFIGTRVLSYAQGLLIGSVVYSIYGFFLVHQEFHE